jgi:hypothetical protein
MIQELLFDHNVANITISHVDMPMMDQRVAGFLDDMDDDYYRPGEEPRRRGDTSDDIQRAFYSGYFKSHGLKAQTVTFPDGMTGSVFVASKRINDNGNALLIISFLFSRYLQMGFLLLFTRTAFSNFINVFLVGCATKSLAKQPSSTSATMPCELSSSIAMLD